MSKPKLTIFLITFILILKIVNLKPENRIKQRGAGILMHITSLPSNYGIGTLGKEAFRFVDFLFKSKQKYWQILPIGPTGIGDNPNNPYSLTCSYAGNTYMIDLDILISEKLLKEEEVKNEFWGEDLTKVDYNIQYNKRLPILEKAFNRFKPNSAYNEFIKENQFWLDDYALYISLKEKFENKIWLFWPEDIKLRRQDAQKRYKKECENKINLIKFIQFKFYEQFNKLRKYTTEKNIKLIGDVPIYVPLDSSDIWTNPKNFQLDSNLNPLQVSGYPPDFFSPDGQLWSNPCYDWDFMAKDDYKWYINRLKYNSKFYDIIRIDHFRGLESYWSIPYGEKTGKNGKWVKGPGMDLINLIKKNLPYIDFIAEDLGFLTKEVLELKDKSGFPGMKILQYAFNAKEKSIYLPYFYDVNTVCYTGTHDNEVLVKWQNELSFEDRKFCEKYCGLNSGADLRYPVIREGMKSVSFLFIVQFQDYLGLGGESRMNVMGIDNGKNWRWRTKPEEINDNLAGEIAHLTKLYGR